MHPHFKLVEDAIKELRKGKMIILTDHPDRENEGDLIFPAEVTTPEMVNFMIKNGSGIICLSLMEKQIKQLGLSYMVDPSENSSSKNTPFTISIEAKSGVTTGVSAADRATTILAASHSHASSDDIVKPGHVFPLHAREGGVLERQGHTEGAIDIVRLAGFNPAAVLCEVMNPDGTMAKGKKLIEFAKKHNIKMLSIADIVAYRYCHENLIEEEVKTHLPLINYDDFMMSVVKEKFTGKEHIVLTNMSTHHDRPLVRIHSSCITGDIFGSQRCDCKSQFEFSLHKISEEGGILIYLDQEGRGVGLLNKIKAYALQEKGLDTVEANQHLGLPIDSREYFIAANILKNLGIHKIKLLTNNPHKISNLQKYGISDIKRESIPVFSNAHNHKYLQTKKHKLNHIMEDARPSRSIRSESVSNHRGRIHHD